MTVKKELKTCFIPITAQPPTFGLVMSIMTIANSYDEVVICVRDEPILIDTKTLLKMLQVVFPLPKFMVISNRANFESITEFPEDLPYFTHCAALSDRIYTNLIIKGYGCHLLARCIGFDEMFHRAAFRQSQALEILRLRNKLTHINEKKTESISEEGEI